MTAVVEYRRPAQILSSINHNAYNPIFRESFVRLVVRPVRVVHRW